MEEARDRFFSKVNKTDSCWLWTAYCNKEGKGVFKIEGKPMLAHRVSWLLAGNTIPDELIVRHKCRSKNCVNPEHLEIGTFADNNGADRRRDETDIIGHRNPNVKLTAEQVLQIRARSTEPQRLLAEEFGVAQNTISQIISGKNWTWLLHQAGNDLI